MIDNLDQIIEAFMKWYENDPHRLDEDAYPELRNEEFIKNLNRDDFIEYFFEFKHDGGKVQSLGYRSAPKFKKMLESKYNDFREFALKPYDANFKLDDWLNQVFNFQFFGKGGSTIYLNRIDKNKYAIVNNKSHEALNKLGYKVYGDFVSEYHAIENAQKELCFNHRRNQPRQHLQNFWGADYTHRNRQTTRRRKRT